MRVKGGYATRRRRKVFNQPRAIAASARRLACGKQAVDRAGQMAYKGRKLKKRDFRRLWIIRINAASRLHGLSYSRFMHGLKKAGIELDRRVLAHLAVIEPDTFASLVEQAKG